MCSHSCKESRWIQNHLSSIRLSTTGAVVTKADRQACRMRNTLRGGVVESWRDGCRMAFGKVNGILCVVCEPLLDGQSDAVRLCGIIDFWSWSWQVETHSAVPILMPPSAEDFLQRSWELDLRTGCLASCLCSTSNKFTWFNCLHLGPEASFTQDKMCVCKFATMSPTICVMPSARCPMFCVNGAHRQFHPLRNTSTTASKLWNHCYVTRSSSHATCMDNWRFKVHQSLMSVVT